MKQFFMSLLLSLCICVGYAQNLEKVSDDKYKHVEDDGFVWYRYLGDNGRVGALNANGDTIISSERGYCEIVCRGYANLYGKSDKSVYFQTYLFEYDGDVTALVKNFFMQPSLYSHFYGIRDLYKYTCGVCDLTGKELVPAIYYQDCLCFKNGSFIYFSTETDKGEIIFDKNGRILYPARLNDIYYFSGCFMKSYENQSIPVSNKISEYYKQQQLLDKASEQGVNVDDILNEGLAFENQRDWTKAIAVYSRAVKMRPSSFAYSHRGRCYFEQGNLKAAMVDLRYPLFLDDCTPDIFSLSDSLLTISEEKYAGIKKERRERMERVIGAIADGAEAMSYGLTAIADMKSDMQKGTTSTSTTTTNTSGMVATDNQNNSKANVTTGHNAYRKRCHSCGGDGKCRGKYHCHGTGVCNWCNGNGTTSVQGNDIKCVNCNGSGKCSFCEAVKNANAVKDLEHYSDSSTEKRQPVCCHLRHCTTAILF